MVADFMCFIGIPGVVTKRDHILGQKTRINNLKELKSPIQCMLSDNRTKLENGYRKNMENVPRVDNTNTNHKQHSSK